MPVAGEPVEVEVISSGEERFEVSSAIERFLRESTGVDNVWTSQNTGKDIIDLKFNHALLASRGTARGGIRE